MFESSRSNQLFIGQLQPGLKNIHTKFTVLEIGAAQRTRKGTLVRCCQVADQTGSINLCLSDEQSEHVTPKSGYALTNGYVIWHKGKLSLAYSKSSLPPKLLDTPVEYVETPNLSAYNVEHDVKSQVPKIEEEKSDKNGRKASSEQNGNNRNTPINQMVRAMKTVNACFIVLDVVSSSPTEDGYEVRARVADPTGSILCIIYVAHEASEMFHSGDIWRIKNGFTTTDDKTALQLYANQNSELMRTGEFCMVYSELPDMSTHDDSGPLIKKVKKENNDLDKEDLGLRKMSLIETQQNRFPHVFINKLAPNMRQINTTFIVLEVGAPRQTSQGNEVRNIKIADVTGSISMAVWNELGEYISSGDIFRLKNGCTVVQKGCLLLSTGKSGEILKTGEFFMAYSEQPDMSVYSKDLDVIKTVPSSNV